MRQVAGVESKRLRAAAVLGTLGLLATFALAPFASGRPDGLVGQIPLAPPAGTTLDDLALTGVACPAADWCAAVGETKNVTGTYQRIEGVWAHGHWRWHRESGGIAHLNAVGCMQPGSCIAVGQQQSADGSYEAPYAIDYGGGQWVPVGPMNPVGIASQGGELNAISCPDASHCVAVGDYGIGSTFLPLVVRVDGDHWTQAPVPPPPRQGYGNLQSVDCASATVCAAVGLYDRTLTGRSAAPSFLAGYQGGRWRSVQAPLPAGWGRRQVRLTEVACAAGRCVAVGGKNASWLASPGLTPQPLAEQFDGSSWRPLEPGGRSPVILAIGCSGEGLCLGAAQTSPTPAASNLYRGDGVHWQRLALPVPTGARAATVTYAISCHHGLCTLVQATALKGPGRRAYRLLLVRP
jgi:hypothetical protein